MDACIFLNNKYTRTYFLLCENRKNRILEGYYEKHHIIPTSLGGKNVATNIIKLTAREHFIAHRLLTKMVVGVPKKKMHFALAFFQTNNKNHDRKLTARQYQLCREALSFAMKGRVVNQRTRDAVSKSRKGIPKSAQEKQQLSEKLQIAHTFFTLDGEKYEMHEDFYRFCDKNKIGRANIQRNMYTSVAVISAGRHKGKCFSFLDVGIELMIKERDKILNAASERRTEARVKQQQNIKHTKKLARQTSIVLKSPAGAIINYMTYLQAARETGIPWTTLQTKQELPWTFLNGRAKGWTLLSRKKEK